MTPAEFLRRFAALIRGEVGSGDRIENAHGFLARFCREQPHLALAVAADVEEHSLAWIDVTGISPGTMNWIPQEIRRRVGEEAARVAATIGQPEAVPAAPAVQADPTLEALVDCLEWLEALQDGGLAGPAVVESIVRARVVVARRRAEVAS